MSEYQYDVEAMAKEIERLQSQVERMQATINRVVAALRPQTQTVNPSLLIVRRCVHELSQFETAEVSR